MPTDENLLPSNLLGDTDETGACLFVYSNYQNTLWKYEIISWPFN